MKTEHPSLRVQATVFNFSDMIIAVLQFVTENSWSVSFCFSQVGVSEVFREYYSANSLVLNEKSLSEFLHSTANLGLPDFHAEESITLNSFISYILSLVLDELRDSMRDSMGVNLINLYAHFQETNFNSYCLPFPRAANNKVFPETLGFSGYICEQKPYQVTIFSSKQQAVVHLIGKVKTRNIKKQIRRSPLPFDELDFSESLMEPASKLFGFILFVGQVLDRLED